jgi:GNAT superfamily N-acetyltransferase
MSRAPDAPSPVVSLSVSDAPRVIDTLCDAFRDYPVMRYVLGDRDPDYPGRLETLIRFFVTARVLRGEPMFGIRVGERLSAVATTSDPADRETPAGLAEARNACWEKLGDTARERYERCGKIWAGFSVPVPHWHLNMIGAREEVRGTGQGGLLLDRVHRLSREVRGSRGVSLTTEDARNVAIYEHAGYRVLDHARVAPELETWYLFRFEDKGGGSRSP